MAAIKFNLTLDNHSVRNLDDLRAHFHVDDILDVYSTDRALHRWLQVRGHTEELAQIEGIQADSPESVVLELARILGVPKDTESLRAWAISAGSRQRNQQISAVKDSDAFDGEAFLDQYHNGFRLLQQQILERRENNAFVQAIVRGTVSKKYYRMVRDYPEHFVSWALKEAPLALFAALMENPLRECIIEHVSMGFHAPETPSSLPESTHRKHINARDVTPEIISSWIEEAKATGKISHFGSLDSFRGQASQGWLQSVNQGVFVLVTALEPPHTLVGHALGLDAADAMLRLGFRHNIVHGGKLFNGLSIYAPKDDFKVSLVRLHSLPGPRAASTVKSSSAEYTFVNPAKRLLRCTSGFTHGAWTHVPDLRRVLVVSTTPGMVVRDTVRHGTELISDEVNGKFPVLEGLECKAPTPKHEVYWIEVLPL